MTQTVFKGPERQSRRWRYRAFAIAPLALALSACGAQGARPTVGFAPPPDRLAATGSAMQDGVKVLSPQGWLDFCARNTGDPACRAAVLTPARADELTQVQAAVQKIPRRTDIQLYHVAEFWTVATRRSGGDCEDLALAARQRLLELGWPASALRLATAWTEQNEYHLVLSVDVVVGGRVHTLIMDSRFPRLKTYDELLDIGYRFNARQASIGAAWVRIQPVLPPRMQMAQLQKNAPSPATSAIAPGATGQAPTTEPLRATVAAAVTAVAPAPAIAASQVSVSAVRYATASPSVATFAPEQPGDDRFGIRPIRYFY